MTNPDYTAIGCLIDRSGSMASIRRDAEGALATFIEDQRKLPGRCTMRLSDFDDTYTCVYPSTPIADVPSYSLVPRGMTALLDGIGKLVTEFGEELAAMDEADRPGQVIVVVQTDGGENCSSEWTREQVFELLTAQQRDYGWQMVFLGANQDAIRTGTGLGFQATNSMTYSATATGAANTGAALSGYVTRTRSGVKDNAFSETERTAAVAD